MISPESDNRDFWPVEVDFQDILPLGRLSEGLALTEIKFVYEKLPVIKSGERYEVEKKIGKNSYRVHFKEISQNVFEMTLRYDNKASLQHYLSNFSKGLDSTGLNEPFPIISFVISSVLSFVEEVKPNGLHIQANETKKNGAYKLLATQVSKQLGWKLIDKIIDGNKYDALMLSPTYDLTT